MKQAPVQETCREKQGERVQEVLRIFIDDELIREAGWGKFKESTGH